jgi:hypothetical protein
LDHPPTPGVGRTTVAIGDDGDVIVCVGEDDLYEFVGDRTSSDSGGAGSS